MVFRIFWSHFIAGKAKLAKVTVATIKHLKSTTF